MEKFASVNTFTVGNLFDASRLKRRWASRKCVSKDIFIHSPGRKKELHCLLSTFKGNDLERPRLERPENLTEYYALEK